MTTVYDVLQNRISTGYTDTPLLLGSRLKEVTDLVINELNRNVGILGIKCVDYKADSGIYSEMFYSVLWNSIIKPTVYEYLCRTIPKAWFLSYYEPKLNSTKCAEKNTFS